jgi:hypothetical protein
MCIFFIIIEDRRSWQFKVSMHAMYARIFPLSWIVNCERVDGVDVILLTIKLLYNVHKGIIKEKIYKKGEKRAV